MMGDPVPTAMRAAFEHWMTHTAKIIVGSSDPYPRGLERDYWLTWKAAWDAAVTHAEAER